VGIEDASETQGGARKRNKTTTSFTEADKEEIIEFLMRNEVLYSKRHNRHPQSFLITMEINGRM